ncbi:MAG: nickel pincer cofactor biosynthesis protein LarC [Desulfotomaculum sp.]|nr:nickel pincer cofactor biosynthesis protein LarC [Desulfotomaculum sp.]
MKVAYFDCFSGAAGDMIVGALLDAGLSLEELNSELNKLNIHGWKVTAEKVSKHGITGTKFNVILDHDHTHHHNHHHRNIHDIKKIIASSTLDEPVKDMALKIFEKLALAEAKVHGTTIDNIHFHEVGALDSIIDIVGTAVGLYKLGIDKVISSPLVTGTGFVQCAHGTIPVPAPATVELLKGIPYRHGDIKEELVTPTGAAVLAALCTEFKPMPQMITSTVGYGGGTKDLPVPNFIRVHIGELADTCCDQEKCIDTVRVIETNIDDMNPELYSFVTNRLMKKGALDVYISQVIMKKGRPGCVLHVLAPPELEEQLGQVILHETTSIGYRSYSARRRMLERKIIPVETSYGVIRVKAAYQNGKLINAAPEYEDCIKAANTYGKQVKNIYNKAIEEFAKKKSNL